MSDAVTALNDIQMGIVYLSEIGDKQSLKEMQGELEQFILDYPTLESQARPVLDAIYIKS